jgi:hypothetical protein
VDIQSLSAFNPEIQTAHESGGQPPRDQTTLEPTVERVPDAGTGQSVGGAAATSIGAVASASYSRNARIVSASTAAAGSISLLA